MPCMPYGLHAAVVFTNPDGPHTSCRDMPDGMVRQGLQRSENLESTMSELQVSRDGKDAVTLRFQAQEGF